MEALIGYFNAIHPLSVGLINHLYDTVKTKSFLKRSYVLKAGHICRNIYFINRGLFRCFYMKDDIEVSCWFMKEGDVIISVESFYQQIESNENIQALEDCEVYFIEYNELKYIYENFPEFNFIGRVLTEKYYKLSEQRLYSLRMQRSAERYQYLIKNHAEIIQKVPLKYIASYLGITEETLSRIRGQIQ